MLRDREMCLANALSHEPTHEAVVFCTAKQFSLSVPSFVCAQTRSLGICYATVVRNNRGQCRMLKLKQYRTVYSWRITRAYTKQYGAKSRVLFPVTASLLHICKLFYVYLWEISRLFICILFGGNAPSSI